MDKKELKTILQDRAPIIEKHMVAIREECGLAGVIVIYPDEHGIGVSATNDFHCTEAVAELLNLASTKLAKSIAN